MPPAYTPAQLIKMAHTQVKRTGLYPTPVVECEGFAAVKRTWPECKSHFIEAYKLRKVLGISAAEVGYYGVANAHNDNKRSLNESLAQVQLANTATMQSFQSNISAVSGEIREL